MTAEEAASELVKTLSSRKQEVVMARSLPKAAIYARSFFPNVFFAVMAAGVRNAAAVEELEQERRREWRGGGRGDRMEGLRDGGER